MEGDSDPPLVLRLGTAGFKKGLSHLDVHVNVQCEQEVEEEQDGQRQEESHPVGDLVLGVAHGCAPSRPH